jgi:hypothetical protein
MIPRMCRRRPEIVGPSRLDWNFIGAALLIDIGTWAEVERQPGGTNASV